MMASFGVVRTLVRTQRSRSHVQSISHFIAGKLGEAKHLFVRSNPTRNGAGNRGTNSFTIPNVRFFSERKTQILLGGMELTTLLFRVAPFFFLEQKE